MKRLIALAAGLMSLLLVAAPARANWFSGVMDPYPWYGHPSYYFPPGLAAFYAGTGYDSLIPGMDYYAPTAVVTPPPAIVPQYGLQVVPTAAADGSVIWTYVAVPAAAPVNAPAK